MFRETRFLIAPLALGLALAGCDSTSQEQATEEGAASGEVLEGTINDAMLPLDEVQSTAPIAAPSSVSAKPADKPAENAAEDENAAEGNSASPAEQPAAAE